MGPFWFRLFYITFSLLSPLCPLRIFVWCLLGALLGCVGGPRPLSVAFALLIFILFFLTQGDPKHFQSWSSYRRALYTKIDMIQILTPLFSILSNIGLDPRWGYGYPTWVLYTKFDNNISSLTHQLQGFELILREFKKYHIEFPH
jgi:hypothetical protein